MKLDINVIFMFIGSILNCFRLKSSANSTQLKTKYTPMPTIPIHSTHSLVLYNVYRALIMFLMSSVISLSIFFILILLTLDNCLQFDFKLW